MDRPTQAARGDDTESNAGTPLSLRLDEASGTVWMGDTPIPLRAKTLGVLRHLALRAGEVVSSDELREAVWGKRHGSEHGPK
jgi:DNA-binding winged helix-turn-helix (wHTH) protein